MSYILDALRKSEQQRSGMPLPIDNPTLSPQPAPETSRFKLPLILLAVALIAGWFFVRPQQPDQRQAPPAKASATTMTKPETKQFIQGKGHDHVITSSATLPETPRTHEQKSTSSAVSLTPTQTPTSQSRPEDAVPVFKPITPISPVSRAENQLPELPDEIAQPSPAETNITSFSELPVSVQQSLPSIHIEGHIYDENPADRMVIINGAIRREKQRLGPNLKLEEITPNGVILNYQGHIFHMGVFDQ